MSKALKNSNLTSRPIARTLAAVSLSISLAAFGCTTDRTLGNGDPVTTPGLRTTPTGGTSSGSETPSVPPSMTSSSSYVGAQTIPSGTQRMRRLSAAEAAAVIAQHAPRVRYLGVAYPGNNSGSASSTVVTGQFQNPALITNPQVTINSTISSQPTTAIASGQGEAVGSTGGGITSAAVINGTILGAATVNGTTGATFGSGLNAAANSPGLGTGIGLGTGAGLGTGTGLGTTSGLGLGGNAGGAAVFSPAAVTGTGVPFGTTNTTISPTVSPTAFTSVTPTGAASGLPALTAPATLTQQASTANAATTATTATTTTGTTSNVRVASPVRITRDANGRAVITNATSSNGSNR